MFFYPRRFTIRHELLIQAWRLKKPSFDDIKISRQESNFNCISIVMPEGTWQNSNSYWKSNLSTQCPPNPQNHISQIKVFSPKSLKTQGNEPFLSPRTLDARIILQKIQNLKNKKGMKNKTKEKETINTIKEV